MSLKSQILGLSDTLDASLHTKADLDNLAPNLPDLDRRSEIGERVLLSAMNSMQFSDSRDYQRSLGLDCGSLRGSLRSYAFALMTHDAVLQVREKTDKRIVVVELGTGSGTNAVAALKADPHLSYVGFEKDELTHEYAKSHTKLYDPQNRAQIVKGDFLSSPLEKIVGGKADIIINENIGPFLLTHEPQLEAAKMGLTIAHKETLFIPSAVNFLLRANNRQTHNLGQIKFNTDYDYPLTFETDFEKDEIEPGRNSFKAFLEILTHNDFPLTRKAEEGLPTLPTDQIFGLKAPEMTSSKSKIRMQVSCSTLEDEFFKPEELFEIVNT